MLILAIILAVAAGCIWLLGAFAEGMSDAPGQKAGTGPIVIPLLLVAAVLFVLWLYGFHFTLISR